MQTPIFDTMVEFFKQDNWNAEQVKDQPVLRMGMAVIYGDVTPEEAIRQIEEANR